MTEQDLLDRFMNKFEDITQSNNKLALSIASMSEKLDSLIKAETRATAKAEKVDEKINYLENQVLKQQVVIDQGKWVAGVLGSAVVGLGFDLLRRIFS